MKKTFLFLIFVLMAIPAFALTSGKIPVATSTSSPGIPSATGDSDITDISGDVYTNGWSDYSGSSTITGFASFTIKYIYTKKVGKTVFVNFGLSGTSNASAITFTLPVHSAQGPTTLAIVSSSTNSTTVAGAVGISGNSTLVTTCYSTVAGGTWTNGTSSCQGQFTYQST